MIRIEFRDGMTGVLRGVTAGVEDLRGAWERVHRILLGLWRETFASEGAYAGDRWAPLSPRYAAWKLRTHGSLPILRLTGRLGSSLTEPSHAEHVFISTPTLMEAGTSVPVYPWVHQKGSENLFGRGIHLPARPPLADPTQAEGEMIVDAVLAAIYERARQEVG